jgi:hypothetical protein
MNLQAIYELRLAETKADTSIDALPTLGSLSHKTGADAAARSR